MTTPLLLENWLSPALVRAVGYTLLHSLWQGAVVAGVVAAALPLLRRHRAEVRYATAAGALASLLLLVGLTFGSYYTAGLAPVTALTDTTQLVAPAGTELVNKALPAEITAFPVVAAAAASAKATAPATPAAVSWLQASRASVEPYLPLLVAGWLLGLLLMSGRLLGGLVYANRLRRVGAQALGAEWQQRLAGLARRAGLRRAVALLESARVAGPLVLGHLRPAILLPLGAVAGLSPALLEALLAHELAHIVRRDYLLNLGLAVAEVLFFYHPAVWFMAACLRAERENCCDDQAAALCGGDRLRVARALAALAELEASPAAMPRLALAAAGVGGRGSLLARVRRLALARPSAPTLGEGLLAGVLAGLGLFGLGTGVALAAPEGSLLANEKEVAQTEQSGAGSLAGSANKALVSNILPARSGTSRLGEAAAEPSLALAPLPQTDPRVRVYSWAQTEPRPRRDGASTVVIEKDKKGRVVSLSVDGQPVEAATDKRSKKAKRGKTAQTVEIMQVPTISERPERIERMEQLERPERLERLDNSSFRFNFNMDGIGSKVARETRRSLTNALRDPNLTAHDRREIERTLRKLKQDVHIDVQALVESDPKVQAHMYRYDLRGLADMSDAARQAERAARQAERDARQADRDADRAGDQNDQDGTDAAVRRAELRARIAAAEAELRALDGTAGRGSVRPPRPPRPPRVPLAPLAPFAPTPTQTPTPPAPPAAPNTARLREALREDGLIKDEKHFSFQLSDEGGRVNGQELTPAQVAKYRELLNKPASKSKGSKSNFSISVDEN